MAARRQVCDGLLLSDICVVVNRDASRNRLRDWRAIDQDVLKLPFANDLPVTDRRPLKHVGILTVESKRLRGVYFGLCVAQIGLSLSSL